MVSPVLHFVLNPAVLTSRPHFAAFMLADKLTFASIFNIQLSDSSLERHGLQPSAHHRGRH